MTKLVVSGASLRCSLGSAVSNLTTASFIEVDGKSIATVADGLPTNVGCFGTCSMTGSTCIPVTARWLPGATNVTVGQVPTLTENCALTCTIGGIISVNDPNQDGVEIG